MSGADSMTRVWIHGASGRMGRAIRTEIDRTGSLQLVGGSGRTFEGEPVLQGQALTSERLGHALESVDLVIDFSNKDGNELLLSCLQHTTLRQRAILIGTTGLGQERVDAWARLAESHDHRVLMAPNTSLGVLMAVSAARQIASALHAAAFDIEICETHHRHKQDAPSGTALMMGAEIAAEVGTEVTARSGAREGREIGIAHLRGGHVFGEHEVRFLGEGEEVRISHRAYDRSLFARGALRLGRWLESQAASRLYHLRDIVPDTLR